MSRALGTAAALAALLAAAAPAAAQPRAHVPTEREVVGRWGVNGDCRNWVSLRADLSFVSLHIGAGEWSLDRGSMDLMRDRGSGAAPPPSQVEILADGSLEFRDMDGEIADRWIRCAAPPPRGPTPARRR